MLEGWTFSVVVVVLCNIVYHWTSIYREYIISRLLELNDGVNFYSFLQIWTQSSVIAARLSVFKTNGLQKWRQRHDDVIKWKHFPRYWPFVRGIHRSPVNSPRKGQWRGALMFSLICARINGWVNNGEAGDLRRHRLHYDVIVMESSDMNQMSCPMKTWFKLPYIVGDNSSLIDDPGE